MCRTTLVLGALGMVSGAGVLTAGLAHAATDPSGVGTDPTAGTLTFTDHSTSQPVTSGPGTELLNWKTTDQCPSPDNMSAMVVTIDPDTNKQDKAASAPASGAGPYAGIAMDDTAANLFQKFTDQKNKTFEVAVVCSSGSGGSEQGAFVYYQYAYISYDSTANTFTVSSTSANPDPSASASGSPTPTASGSRTPSPAVSPTPAPTVGAIGLPLGGAGTGAGGAARPGSGNKLLLALGVALFAGSGAAMWVAARRGRALGASALGRGGLGRGGLGGEHSPAKATPHLDS